MQDRGSPVHTGLNKKWTKIKLPSVLQPSTEELWAVLLSPPGGLEQTLIWYTAHTIAVINESNTYIPSQHTTTILQTYLALSLPVALSAHQATHPPEILMSLNVCSPHQASDGIHNRLASQGQGMYHSGHSDLICKLALSHSDQLPQVTVTSVKGDNPTFSDHFVH